MSTDVQPSQHITTSHQSLRSQRLLVTPTGSPAPIDPNNPPSVNDQRFRGRSQVWLQNYEKGLQLWRKHQNALVSPRPYIFHRLKPTLNVLPAPGRQIGRRPFFQDGCLNHQGILRELDRRFPEDPVRLCDSKEMSQFSFVRVSTKKGLPEGSKAEFRYDGWYSGKHRAVLSRMNVGKLSASEIHKYPPFDTIPEPLSAKFQAPLGWAEVVTQVWQSFAHGSAQLRTRDLRFVLRSETPDHETCATAGNAIEFYQRRRQTDRTGQQTYEYNKTSADFYALLGSPDGEGVADMLTTYSSIFRGFRPETRNMKQGYRAKTIDTILVNILGAPVVLSRPTLTFEWINLAFIFREVEPLSDALGPLGQ